MAKEKSTKKSTNKKTTKKVETKPKDNKKEFVKKDIKEEITVVEETKTEKKEKVKKEKVKKEKKERKKVDANELFTKVDNHRVTIITGVVCFLLATLLFRGILWPDRIATLKDGTQPIVKIDGTTITADDLYEYMKKEYTTNLLLNQIDNIVLKKLYPDSKEMDEEITKTAENYYTSYESYYGYTKEQFLSSYGFETEKEFIEQLELDYRRNKYYDEYAESLITKKDIEKYYEKEVYGDVNSKHILVNIKAEGEKEGLSDEEAKKLAKEIIKKLDDGEKWEDLIKKEEYKDKITAEELDYQPFNASLEKAYLKEMKDLKKGTYSKTPVLTSYGYHIVYKIDQKEKPKLEDIEDTIIEILAKEKKDNDTDLYSKALLHLREEHKLEFSDSVFKEEYEENTKKFR